jgi:hypothetical protein
MIATLVGVNLQQLVQHVEVCAKHPGSRIRILSSCVVRLSHRDVFTRTNRVGVGSVVSGTFRKLAHLLSTERRPSDCTYQEVKLCDFFLQPQL